jgi:multiple sugar transport system permease protein
MQRQVGRRQIGWGRVTAVEQQARQRRLKWGRIAAWAVLVLLIVVTIFPFYWALRTGLSDNRSLATNVASPLPVDFTLGAFRRVLGFATTAEAQAEGGSGGSLDFWLFLRNSVIFATIVTAGQVFFSSMAAYAFAWLRWPGRDKLFFVFLLGLMVPPIFIFLPNFVLVRDLGLLNTFPGMVAPFVLMSPFAVFFLRQFLLTVSSEIYEAALLDGASHFTIFRKVMLPIIAPAITTLAVLVYFTSWNEYLWPLLVGSKEEVRVLTVALGVFRAQTPQLSPDWAGLMAATLVAAAPVMAIFALVGRRLVDTIQFTGLR